MISIHGANENLSIELNPSSEVEGRQFLVKKTLEPPREITKTKNCSGTQGGFCLFPFICVGAWGTRKRLREHLILPGITIEVSVSGTTDHRLSWNFFPSGLYEVR